MRQGKEPYGERELYNFNTTTDLPAWRVITHGVRKLQRGKEAGR